MKTRQIFIPVLLLCLLISPLMTQAQTPKEPDLSESFSNEEGWLSLQYPAGWATCDCAPGLVYVYSDPDLDLAQANPQNMERGQFVLTLLNSEGTSRYAGALGPIEGLRAEQIIENFIGISETPEIFSETETFEIEGRPAARADIDGMGLSILAMETRPRQGLLIFLTSRPDEQGDYDEIILAVLASIDDGQSTRTSPDYNFPDSDLYLAYTPNWQLIGSDSGPVLLDLQAGASLLLTAAPVEDYPEGEKTDWAEVANEGVEWADMLSGSEVIPAEAIQIGEWPAWAAYILADGSYTLYLVINVDEEYIVTLLAVSDEEEAITGAADRISEELSFYIEP